LSRHRADLVLIERRENLEAERTRRAKAAYHEVEAGKSETIALRLVRGDEIRQPDRKRGERDKPARVFDGWDLAREAYLKSGDRALANAGEKYAETYRTAWGSGMKCGNSETVRGAVTAAEARDAIARRELSTIHRDALANLKSLVMIVEAVCGRGETLLAISGAKHAIPVHKERLTNALALLAVHYRMEV